jgi:MoaA/NifB/PqqE/SkfB family radical SAM enzyme/SAM-dependent methyltransferase
MKALIKVGYGCNEHCSFCHTAEVRHIDGDADETHRKIRRAKELGHTMVVLSGGEPTIRPELMAWAAHVASLDMDLGLVTNGLVLAYPEVVDELLAHRLRYVYMSLHGGDARTHNALVRADSFDLAMRAVRNLSGRGLDFTLNCVVTRQNVARLLPLVDAVLPYTDVVLKFSMVQPKGGGQHLFEHLAPRVSEVGARVSEAIAHGRARVAARGAVGPRFAHDGIPLCLLPGLEDLYDDLKTHRFRTMVEVGEPDFFPVDDLAKVQPDETCAGCMLRGPCPGLFRGYLDVHGPGELKAVRGGARSNSFSYVLETVVPAPVGERDCPLRDGPLGVTPWDRGRDLYVHHGGKLARYRTETRDFSDLEIATVKHELGQVYFDASRKVAPDDFARDLVPLRRAARCDGCPHEAPCTGMFEPLFEDVFTRDDAYVRALIAALEGDVLDLGAGEGAYHDLIASALASGAIRYTAVEPDAERAEVLLRRLPRAHVVAARAEEFVLEASSFDHVLVLRSWNHMHDPPRVVGALARAIRPGGSLLVVDNVAFGLARGRAQQRAAERASTGFEHYRNDDASAADAVVLASGAFERLERRDVAPGTSNQWVLRYRRH